MMMNLDLSAAIRQVLADAAIEGRVKVETTGAPGVFRLVGEVFSEEEKLRADQTVRSVDGVLDVMDEISVGRRLRTTDFIEKQA